MVISVRLTIGSSDRGAASSVSQGGVDDRDKLPSFDVGAIPRRSTSSLEAVLDTGIALVYRICYEQFGGQRFSRCNEWGSSIPRYSRASSDAT